MTSDGITNGTTGSQAAPSLRLRGIGKRFGGLLAVGGLDLEVAHGERRAVLGPNGAGKTTLFNLVAGDLEPTTGTIELLGTDITHLPSDVRALQGIARTYQQSRLFHGLSAEDNIVLAIIGIEKGQLRPVRRRDRDRSRRQRARAAASRLAIDHKLKEPIETLSHGEHRQVALAMALVVEPQVLLLDEPAAGLSRGERQLLTELLLQLDRDITLVLIEHDMDVALRVADRVTMMHDGRIIVEGTPAEIRANETVHDLYLGRGHRDE